MKKIKILLAIVIFQFILGAGIGWYFTKKNVIVDFITDTFKPTQAEPVKLAATKSESIHLDVPAISQLPELPTGCEITSVAMLLQFNGISVDKLSLAREMPYHRSDPNLGFVGSPFSQSGYTIHPSGLMGILQKYLGSAVDLTGSDPSVFEQYLQENKPVIVWARLHSFRTHTIVITGYDDSKYYYNDPWTGQKDLAMGKENLHSLWKELGKKALSY